MMLISESDLTLFPTSSACPEQYDVVLGDKLSGEQVGYIRIRHGRVRVDCPDCGGETVYEAGIRGDGMLDSDEIHPVLETARKEIAEWYNRTNVMQSA